MLSLFLQQLHTIKRPVGVVSVAQKKGKKDETEEESEEESEEKSEEEEEAKPRSKKGKKEDKVTRCSLTPFSPTRVFSCVTHALSAP